MSSIDAGGRRRSKSSPVGTTIFAYDEEGHLIGEYTSAGVMLQEIVWLKGLPVASLRPAASGGRIDMLIGGFGARSGVLVNLKTRETCQVAYRCMNLGIGALASLGSDASIGVGGPSCGKDLGPIEIGLSVEVLTPAGTGFNCSVDVVGAGVSAGIGPSAGIGAFVGGSICELRTISCQKTPRSCLK